MAIVDDELLVKCYRSLIRAQWYPRDLGPVEYCHICKANDIDGHLESCELQSAINDLRRTHPVHEYLMEKHHMDYDDLKEGEV